MHCGDLLGMGHYLVDSIGDGGIQEQWIFGRRLRQSDRLGVDPRECGVVRPLCKKLRACHALPQPVLARHWHRRCLYIAASVAAWVLVMPFASSAATQLIRELVTN